MRTVHRTLQSHVVSCQWLRELVAPFHIRMFDRIAKRHLLAVLTGCWIAFAARAGDCNGNGVPDRDEINQLATYEWSPDAPASPFGNGHPAMFKLSSPPFAIDEVTLTFFASADLSSGNERVDLFIDDQPFGQILNNADDCSSPPDEDSITLTALQWNEFAADRSVFIKLDPTQGVNPEECDRASFITMSVSYHVVPANDLDQDGILDECQSRCQGDAGGVVPSGTVDGADLGQLLGSWGPCPGCEMDLNGDGSVDGTDLGLLLGNWGPCPADISVAKVWVTPDPVDAGDFVDVSLLICNSGPPIALDVEVFGPGDDTLIPGQTIESGCQTFLQTQIQAPLIEGQSGCGQSQAFEVLACVQAPDDDPNPDNDCAVQTLHVIPLYWDLHLNVQAPACAQIGSSIQYTVLVTNQGNKDSPSLPSGLRTGVCLNASDPQCWTNNCICGDGFPQDCVGGGILCLNIPPVIAGDTVPIVVQYAICNGACCGTQMAKAGLNRCVGVDDDCSSGNFDFETICVFPPLSGPTCGGPPCNQPGCGGCP